MAQQPPPFDQNLFGPTGEISEIWRRFLLKGQTQLVLGGVLTVNNTTTINVAGPANVTMPTSGILVTTTTAVTSITGTANQITATAAVGAVTLSLAGPHNFTTQIAQGVVIGNGTSALQTVPLNTTATNKFLRQVSSGAPAFITLVAGDIPDISATYSPRAGNANLVTVGTLTAGATGAGFTIALSVSTVTGTLPAAQFPALTGDVTTVAGALATTIGVGKVTNTMLAGSITAAKLVGTDIATVGTLTAGATGAGFTVALSTSTITGTLADARLSANVPLLNTSNTFTLINPIITAAESWIGPSSTAGIYFKTSRVGIGTIAPRATLDVKDTIYLGATAVADGNVKADDSCYITIDANNDNTDRVFGVLHDAGAELFRVQENGNFGIGTTGPLTMFSVAEKLQVNSSGLMPKYNNITTVSNGVPAEYATIDTTGLTANVAAATLYAVPASGAGMYRVSAYVVLTVVGSISSTLPNVQIVYTDNDTNTSVTIDATPVLGVAGIGQTGALTANTVGTVSGGIIPISVKASTTIQYQTVNYASNVAGMTYALHLKLEAL